MEPNATNCKASQELDSKFKTWTSTHSLFGWINIHMQPLNANMRNMIQPFDTTQKLLDPFGQALRANMEGS